VYICVCVRVCACVCSALHRSTLELSEVWRETSSVNSFSMDWKYTTVVARGGKREQWCSWRICWAVSCVCSRGAAFSPNPAAEVVHPNNTDILPYYTIAVSWEAAFLRWTTVLGCDKNKLNLSPSEFRERLLSWGESPYWIRIKYPIILFQFPERLLSWGEPPY